MIHIKRNPKTKQYRVVYAGKNGEVLAVSESLKSKQSAWKNIGAMFTDTDVLVQDDTIVKTIVYCAYNLGKERNPYVKPQTCKYKF